MRRRLSTEYVGCSGSSLVSSRGCIATSSLRFPLMRQCERRSFIVVRYFRTRAAPVNAKCVAAAFNRLGAGFPGCGSGGFRQIPCAELGGQPTGGRLHQLGAALQHLVGHPPDRAGNAERADHFAGEIIDRHCDAAHFRVEFAVVEGDRAAPDLGDFAQQHGRVGDRLLRRRFQLDRVRGSASADRGAARPG